MCKTYRYVLLDDIITDLYELNHTQVYEKNDLLCTYNIHTCGFSIKFTSISVEELKISDIGQHTFKES